ncbi:hypothetical protein N9A28_07740 [Sulfurimonas sp.]|nr:hypothetical protein [Sulfurimonas sp.]
MLYSIALSLLLGFELSYYLLIVQTGIVSHLNSDISSLIFIFLGGVFGTYFAGQRWIVLSKPIEKIIFALTIQLILSFFYPNYNMATLVLLGVSVGLMAPLSIYIYSEKQLKELLIALAIAYSVGTYYFTSGEDIRFILAVVFSAVALLSSLIIRNYEMSIKSDTHAFIYYAIFILWVFLDTNLFETLSRHLCLDIWTNYTLVIILFHLIGLISAYFIQLDDKKVHIFIAILFFSTYLVSYLKLALLVSMLYPFTVSYYNVLIFTALSKEMSLKKLALIMLFVGWIASGLGFLTALSGILS